MFKTIIAALDGSDHGRRAVAMAAKLAAHHGARLVLVHVVGEGDVPEGIRRMAEIEHLVKAERTGGSQVANVSGSLSVSERGETAAHRVQVNDAIADWLLADAKRACSGAGAKDVKLLKEYGDPARVIVKLAQDEGADLLVMGRRGLSDMRGLLMGSVSHKVCQFAPSPCLTVK